MLHDIVAFLFHGEPELVVLLLPRFLLAVALVAALSLVRRRPFLLIGIVVLLFLLSLLPQVFDLASSPADRWRPRILGTMLLCVIASSHIVRRWNLGPWRTGLTLGSLAAVAVAANFKGFSQVSSYAAATSLVIFLLGFVRGTLARRAGTAVCVAIPLIITIQQLREDPVFSSGEPRGGDVSISRTPRPNLILIVLDTVRADRLEPYGYGRTTTPGIDGFVSEHATIYTQARSTSSWSLPSHASLFTGLMPSEHGARHSTGLDGSPTGNNPLDERFDTLAERLVRRSYRTAAIVANPWFLKPSFGLAQGFDHYDSRPGAYLRKKHLNLAHLAGAPMWIGHLPYRNAGSVTERALSWLDQEHANGPFFLMLNYMDAHKPYLPPPPFNRAFGGAAPGDPLRPAAKTLSDIYDRELLYLDSEVTRLLRGLEEKDLFQGTTIVITSDHGEAFGEHGLWNHDKQSLHEEVVRIPLYVKPAGGRRSIREAGPIDSAGLFRLMLREVGLDEEAAAVPSSAFFAEWHEKGVDESWQEILPAMERHQNLLAWIDGGTKFVVSTSGRVQAFELGKDPGEHRPLSISESRADEARKTAQAWWDAHPFVPVELDSTVTDDVEILRALGYAGE